MKEVITTIAKENNVNVEEVEKAMQEAISLADSREMEALRKSLGREPSVEEFILYCAAQLS